MKVWADHKLSGQLRYALRDSLVLTCRTASAMPFATSPVLTYRTASAVPYGTSLVPTCRAAFAVPNVLRCPVLLPVNDKVTCPFCREDWGPLALDNIKKEIRNARRPPNVSAP